MNADEMQGNWKILKGRAKQKWGDLTDDEVDRIDGRWDELVGTIQKKYGIAREEAEKQVRAWE